MPPTHSDEGIRAAKGDPDAVPDVAVLVLSQYIELRYAMELLADSVESVGYLLKDRVSDVNEFRASVRRVAEGGSAIDRAVVAQLVGRHRDDDPIADLTPREREVLELMAEGRSNHGIATKLVVTEHVVEKHIRNIFQKLHIDSGPDDHRRVLAVLLPTLQLVSPSTSSSASPRPVPGDDVRLELAARGPCLQDFLLAHARGVFGPAPSQGGAPTFERRAHLQALFRADLSAGSRCKLVERCSSVSDQTTEVADLQVFQAL
jgi:DNA-binding NarL/FixJ family response regulator